MQILKRGITLIEIIINHLSMLSIRSKKIYVFGAWKGNKFSDNPKYLYLEALKDKSLIAVWITRNKEIYTALKAQGFRVYLYKSIPGIYYQLRASVYFTCMSKHDVLSLIMGNATRINLWHGPGFKKILNDDKVTPRKYNTSSIKKYIWKTLTYLPKRKEYIVSTSDKMTEIFAKAFGKRKEKILQLGQPRNDIFFCDELEVENFRFKDSGKKVILYMPTHRNAGRKRMFIKKILDLELLNQFCKENNVLFLIKKHYYHNQETENLDSYENIIDITQKDYDSQQLLKYADILITDFSSCFIDFLLLNRPIIFYNYDYEDYILNDRDLYFDYNSTTPGQKATNFNELVTSLQNVLKEGIDPFVENRQVIKNMYYSENNQKKVGRKILDFVKENL